MSMVFRHFKWLRGGKKKTQQNTSILTYPPPPVGIQTASIKLTMHTFNFKSAINCGVAETELMLLCGKSEVKLACKSATSEVSSSVAPSQLMALPVVSPITPLLKISTTAAW